MTIHKGNIEAYLLDYIEGNLDALLTAELMAFLSENPEYEKWIPEYDGHLCPESGPLFEEKPMLKKNFKDIPSINEHNFDEFCIASCEGLLEKKEQIRLEEYIVLHPEKHPEYGMYGKSILQPDYLLVYPDKKGLKKREPAVIPLRFIYYAIGMAASIALLLLLVSRKPADQALSGKTGEKPGFDQRQSDKPAPENSVPGSSTKTITAVPSGDPFKKYTDTPKEVAIPGEITPDTEPLAAIEPIKTGPVYQSVSGPEIRRITRQTGFPVPDPGSKEPAYATEPTPISILGSAVKKLNLWKAAEKAVTGFNYLTESRVSLVRTTDENGKFSSLSLQSEDYYISDNKVK